MYSGRVQSHSTITGPTQAAAMPLSLRSLGQQQLVQEMVWCMLGGLFWDSLGQQQQQNLQEEVLVLALLPAALQHQQQQWQQMALSGMIVGL